MPTQNAHSEFEAVDSSNVDVETFLSFAGRSSGQSYKAPTIVIYNSRVLPDLKIYYHC